MAWEVIVESIVAQGVLGASRYMKLNAASQETFDAQKYLEGLAAAFVIGITAFLLQVPMPADPVTATGLLGGVNILVINLFGAAKLWWETWKAKQKPVVAPIAPTPVAPATVEPKVGA